MKSVCEDFKESKFSNIFEFLFHKQFVELVEVHARFLEKINVNAEERFNNMKLDPVFSSIVKQDFLKIEDPVKRYIVLSIIADNVMAEVYGLKISNWSPSDSFQEFIDTLNASGPLAVSGFFGTPFYKQSPKKLTGINGLIGGHQVYYFNKDDFLGPDSMMNHKILLIGAKTLSNTDYVYFLDPMDPSSPSRPSERKIYMMTYRKLTRDNLIFDLYGLRRFDASKEVGYAHYSSQGHFMQKLQ